MGVMLTRSPFRLPIFSITAPMHSSGTSATIRSIGSQTLPSMVLVSTRGVDTLNSYPSRRMVSMRMLRCISPRPATLKASVPCSVTWRETSFNSSRSSRSRRFREVTYLPSFPAKGESLTAKVISMVGSEIFTKDRGSTASGAHRVRPMVMSAMPLRATISPAEASWMGFLLRPSNSYRATTFPFCRSSGSW